jgi:hypothetical protein
MGFGVVSRNFAEYVFDAQSFACAWTSVYEYVSSLPSLEQVSQVASDQFQIGVAAKRLSAWWV